MWWRVRCLRTDRGYRILGGTWSTAGFYWKEWFKCFSQTSDAGSWSQFPPSTNPRVSCALRSRLGPDSIWKVSPGSHFQNRRYWPFPIKLKNGTGRYLSVLFPLDVGCVWSHATSPGTESCLGLLQISFDGDFSSGMQLLLTMRELFHPNTK